MRGMTSGDSGATPHAPRWHYFETAHVSIWAKIEHGSLMEFFNAFESNEIDGWAQYQDPASGKLWWYCAAPTHREGTWFFEDDGVEHHVFL